MTREGQARPGRGREYVGQACRACRRNGPGRLQFDMGNGRTVCGAALCWRAVLRGSDALSSQGPEDHPKRIRFLKPQHEQGTSGRFPEEVPGHVAGLYRGCEGEWRRYDEGTWTTLTPDRINSVFEAPIGHTSAGDNPEIISCGVHWLKRLSA